MTSGTAGVNTVPRDAAKMLVKIGDQHSYLEGREFYVLPGHEQVVLLESCSLMLRIALKVISCFPVAKPFFMYFIENSLRAAKKISFVDPRQELEKGISISIDRVQEVVQLAACADLDVIRYPSSHGTVFSLRSNPQFIFKIQDQASAEGRFANMIRAKEVCLVHKLGLLVIPSAKKFDTSKGVSVIVEERIDTVTSESEQRYLYSKLSGLEGAIRQLTRFIAQTGLSDIAYRNLLIAETDPEFEGDRHIALVDLEEMAPADGKRLPGLLGEGTPRVGIFGNGMGRTGLVNILFSEVQIDAVLDEVRQEITTGTLTDLQAYKMRRMAEVAFYKRLCEFYEQNGLFTNPGKLIEIEDLRSLGLNLNETCEAVYMGRKPLVVVMQQAIKDIIEGINDGITANASTNKSADAKRCIILDIYHGHHALHKYNIGAEGTSFVDGSFQRSKWIARICEALKEKGHIFSHYDCGHGYSIQA